LILAISISARNRKLLTVTKGLLTLAVEKKIRGPQKVSRGSTE
jgi:hypothetical protein